MHRGPPCGVPESFAKLVADRGHIFVPGLIHAEREAERAEQDQDGQQGEHQNDLGRNTPYEKIVDPIENKIDGTPPTGVEVFHHGQVLGG